MRFHLDGGKRHMPGDVHIDAIDYPGVDDVATIDSLSFLGDRTVDLIYNCLVLEHFKRRDVAKVLAVWKRVLRPGSTLPTSVPDFASRCEVNQRRGNKIELLLGASFGRQNYLCNIYCSAFDFSSLSSVPEEVGFTDVRKYHWRNTQHADADDYSQADIPYKDKQSGIPISVNVECVKPSDQ